MTEREKEKEKENRERFLKVGLNRFKNILKSIEVLQPVSNKVNYKYEESEIKKLFSRIKKELKETENMFNAQERQSKKEDPLFDRSRYRQQ